MKRLFLNILLLSPLSFFAQDIEPLLSADKTWSCYGDYFFLNVKYRLGADTVMNGKTYKKVMAHGSDIPFNFDESQSQYKSALREENGKVIVVEKNFINEHILYDYTKNVGDTIRFYRPIGDFNQGVLPQYVIGKVYKTDVVTMQGVARKRLFIHDPYMVDLLPPQAQGGLDSQADIWIEGLGSKTGLFSRMPEWGVIGATPYLLTCVEVNGNLVYSNNLGYEASTEDPCFIIPPEGSNSGGGGGSTGGGGSDSTGTGGNDSLILGNLSSSTLKIKIYPNPARESFFISPLKPGYIKVCLISSSGNTLDVYTLRVEGNSVRIPLNGIKSGLYQVLTETSEGFSRLRLQIEQD